MPNTTTCTRCGRAYDESSADRADVPAWAADRLCPDCYRFEQRGARIRADLDAGRLPDPDLLTAQVEHVESEDRAARADLRALAHDADVLAGYTVAAPDVGAADVLEALTAGHDADAYRSAIERDGLDAVAARELRDLIDAGHLVETEDEAERDADGVLARDPTSDPRVLTITAEDVAEHMRAAGWCEPEPRRLFADDGASTPG